jgi:tetratricopeptide (TPR) repeat protein
VSVIRFFGIICFSASLYAQYGQFSGAGNFSVMGELRSRGSAPTDDLVVEVYDVRSNSVVEREPVNHGQFQLDHVPPGSFSVRLVAAPGEAPIVEEFHEFQPGGAPLVLDMPDRSPNKPASGSVSLRELQHPISKKAMHEALEAQQLSLANNLPKAIAKLENAIRIDPLYRDAHLNLGVDYARTGRVADARAEFQKALDIGPPAAPIYVDLALISLALHQNQEAASFAEKALELEPMNGGAQRVLEHALSH